MSEKIAAIVVTYNSGEYIRPCIESLRGQTRPVRIIVVDNASSDDSAVTATEFGAELVESGANLGYAGGNNIGLATALKDPEVEYILLINPDAVADARLAEELVASLSKDERRAVAQSKMFLAREPELINAAGICHHYLYFGYCEKYRHPDSDTEDREIAVASGACMMIRRSVIEELGYLFDDEFFMYHEDSDFCIRALLRGYKCVLSARAVAWHDYRFGSSAYKFYHMEKNRLYLMLQNYRAFTLALLLPAIAFTEAQVLAFSILKGWGWAKIKSYIWLAANMGKAMDSRARVQRTRVAGDLELLERFVPDLAFPELASPLVRYITDPILTAYIAPVKWAVGLVYGKGVKDAG
jgi:GT2 family glycosyltransferase